MDKQVKEKLNHPLRLKILTEENRQLLARERFNKDGVVQIILNIADHYSRIGLQDLANGDVEDVVKQKQYQEQTKFLIYLQEMISANFPVVEGVKEKKKIKQDAMA